MAPGCGDRGRGGQGGGVVWQTFAQRPRAINNPENARGSVVVRVRWQWPQTGYVSRCVSTQRASGVSFWTHIEAERVRERETRGGKVGKYRMLRLF